MEGASLSVAAFYLLAGLAVAGGGGVAFSRNDYRWSKRIYTVTRANDNLTFYHYFSSFVSGSISRRL